MAIATMHMRLCQFNEILCSITEYKVFQTCNVRFDEVKKAFVPTELNGLNIEHLQNSIVCKKYPRQNCSTCSNSLDQRRVYNEIVAFDIELTQIHIKYVAINKIVESICLDGQIYKLKSWKAVVANTCCAVVLLRGRS